MTYFQFICAVKDLVKEELKDNTLISIYTAEKNNGVTKNGITISEKGINIAPTIYLEDYYEKYNRGADLEVIVEDILCLYQEIRFQESWEERDILDYHFVKDRIVYRLVNWEKNKRLLKKIPHENYLDLAIVFYVLLDITNHGTAMMLVHDEYLEEWGVTKEELYLKAKENTEKLLPYEFETMGAVMEKYMEEPVYWDEDILYVLSNKIHNFGAAAILYERRLERIGELLEDNFYVLPSSVHEVIIIAEKDLMYEKEGLIRMVTEINHTQVDDEEVLSDNVYYYDRTLGKLV